MAKQTINMGTAPAGTDGDTVRAGFAKVNGNFDELYARVQGALVKSIAGGAGTVALSATEALNGLIDLNGAISGNKVVTVPATPAMLWMVRNSTSGNFSVTFQAVGGAGVVVPRGQTKLLYSDGANVIDIVPVNASVFAYTAAGVEVRPNAAANQMSYALALVSGASGEYRPFLRSNATDQSIEFVNSANNRVTLKILESGATTFGGWVTISDPRNATKLTIANYGPGFGWGASFRPQVGGTSEPMVFQNVSGNVVGVVSTTDSATVYGTTSDYRLKRNWKPIGDALASVRRMRFYVGEYAAEPGRLYDYALAHEIQEEVPTAVVGQKDAMGDWYPVFREGYDPDDVKPEDVVEVRQMIAPQAVDYSRLVPRLGAAVQELASALELAIARIEQLEAAAA